MEKVSNSSLDGVGWKYRSMAGSSGGDPGAAKMPAGCSGGWLEVPVEAQAAPFLRLLVLFNMALLREVET